MPLDAVYAEGQAAQRVPRTCCLCCQSQRVRRVGPMGSGSTGRLRFAIAVAKKRHAYCVYSDTMSDHDLCMSLLAARSLALSLCRSLAIMLGPYHVSTPSRQPGLFCVLEHIEWVAGGSCLTFVIAQREPHWSCATQTCLSLLSLSLSLHP